MKRALVLFGAGASIDYGAPSTATLTQAIENTVQADAIMRHTGGDVAFRNIRARLGDYLGAVNFEQIYHCVHELIYTFSPPAGAVDEYRPLLVPFIKTTLDLDRQALEALADKIVEVIYTEASNCCEAPLVPLGTLENFIAGLRRDWITRIYTTNYDDFLLQAAPDLYIGFDPAAPSPKRLDIGSFWNNEDQDCLLYLHGSVHMGFPNPLPFEIGELGWFDDRVQARQHALFQGGAAHRMDGTGVLRTSIITGLDKLSRLQQRPFSHFYSALGRDAMLCDVIYVIGSGLADYHLNNWLHEARSLVPRTPILFVDLWKDGFGAQKRQINAKLLRMFHSLRIEINEA
jgi:hypothetical protein